MTDSLTYPRSTFREIRDAIFADPYDQLPAWDVTIGSMFTAGRNMLLNSCRILVRDTADFGPPYQKLVHPIGVCLTGRWRITQPTPYTGYFREGAEGLVVARCSTLLSNPIRGPRRGFGFAVKIFPTLDPNEPVRTANCNCIDVLGGTFARRFTDVALTNEPELGLNPGLIRYSWVVVNALYSFFATVKTPIFRPVDAVAELGLAEGERAVSPRWVQLAQAAGNGKSDEPDMRRELAVENYADKVLRYVISAAPADPQDPTVRRWDRIGEIVLDESVCSYSGDHRLRFYHPPAPDALAKAG